ncbi:Quinidine resistance protein 1 [Cyphellophora attinorum]|uniref:Quinidine resistance protein 1 n=1 Tax=Cyphellophora attinorum TaxID=1664694 RepID=A0A0N0NQF4_9EURO|nr:Quinidine resistance protein 1 [Phialophora attinorum]KPI43639.1 Quinidine resistance protein 1 [Phialophora attinorum]
MSNTAHHNNESTHTDSDIAPPLALKSEPYSIFDRRQKAIIVFLVAVAATFSGFASNAYFPAITAVARDLHVSNELINLTITAYLVFQGLGPSLWSPLSDVKGRRIAYICCFIVFIAACIGLGLCQNYATLLVLRMLQSAGSASTITIGSGVLGDITTRAERGGYMGIFQAGFLTPVAIGPVIGGALAGALGWRSIFWFIVIYCGIFLAILVLVLPETLRYRVGNGSRLPTGLIGRWPLVLYQKTTKVQWASSPPAARPSKKHVNVLGPLRILTSKQAAPIILFLSIQYTVWYMGISAIATLFEERYRLSETQIGLTFIANGVGSMLGTLTTGKILDIDFQKIQRKLAEESGSDGTAPVDPTDPKFPLERARLRLMPAFTIVQVLSLLLFGWTVHYSDKVPLAIPIISTFVTGWTAVGMQSAITTYLVDVFSDQSAAASASLNLARCLLAAGGTSIIIPLINAIGVGWAFTLCAVVQILSLAGVFVQWKFAGKWRQEADEKSATS